MHFLYHQTVSWYSIANKIQDRSHLLNTSMLLAWTQYSLHKVKFHQSGTKSKLSGIFEVTLFEIVTKPKYGFMVKY